MAPGCEAEQPISYCVSIWFNYYSPIIVDWLDSSIVFQSLLNKSPVWLYPPPILVLEPPYVLSIFFQVIKPFLGIIPAKDKKQRNWTALNFIVRTGVECLSQEEASHTQYLAIRSPIRAPRCGSCHRSTT